ncbi:MarR family transcriptional regulator [Occultella glacieicola]|uniref:MarR family transcriptional regulator n=1 Tax=Occultella glacieicola TaxID=2518684 RepID=A0ABY2E193_9MICO|nr:MarR family transcriptional regulator [Occultella glacieicola]TDE91697.1 MarR family transcriptional regulator [Occultella glacieicola]
MTQTPIDTPTQTPPGAEVRWLDAEQQAAWRALLTGTSVLFEALGRDLEHGTGLSLHEYEVLVRLSEAPGRVLRMSVLAEELVHSRSRLTHTVSRMERDGLVSRCSSSQDGRGVDCMLTDAGMARLEEAAPVHVASVRRRLIGALSREQLLDLGVAFNQIDDAVRAHRS